MSDFSLTLVLQFKTSKIINDMAKVQIKSEKVTPFGGIFHVRELFSRYMAPIIDKVLGLRCASYGYQYSEIAGSLSSVYFCGGDCVEDVTSHLMPHLSLHPTLRTCSSDTILRGISELATVNTTYTSDTGKSYDFNTATKLNSLLVKVLKNTGQLVAGERLPSCLLSFCPLLAVVLSPACCRSVPRLLSHRLLLAAEGTQEPLIA